MRTIAIICFVLLSCSHHGKTIDSQKVNRIINLINASNPTSSSRQALDTIVQGKNFDDSMFYTVYYDSSYKIQQIEKSEYFDTIKIMHFFFFNDSLLSIWYNGRVPESKKKNDSWGGLYYIENNRVFAAFNDKMQVNLDNEINEANYIRDRFYSGLGRSKPIKSN